MAEPALNMLATGLMAAFALIMGGMTILAVRKSRKTVGEARSLTRQGLDLLEGETSPLDRSAADHVEALFSGSDLEAWGDHLARLSRLHYEGRMLPDPDPVLASLGLFPDRRLKNQAGAFAFMVFAAGGLGSLVMILLYLVGNLKLRVLAMPLALMVLALLLALFLFWYGSRLSRDVKEEKDRLRLALTSSLPAFMDTTGLAVLVSEMIGYGEKMREEVQVFGQLARDLAEGDFAEGIKTSVRDIMSQEVAPPLKASNEALTDLAKSLADKQEKGMADLAEHFSEDLAKSLALHLAPLPDKLQILHQVAAHSADMMEESMASMTRTREENKLIHEDVREALRLMTLAKNDLTDEMASVSDSMEILAGTTEKMTSLYADEEVDLASHIDRMTDQLRLYSDKIGQGIEESAKAIEASVRMSASHNKNAAILLERLDEQLGMLEEINRQIKDNTQHFTKESASFVSRTLDEYDVSLAEVVERLTFTTAEIRDAVDALPQAIRGAGGRED